MNRWLIALLLVGIAGPITAQPIRVIAFGDSITRGNRRFDEENKGGFPGRLQGKLRAIDPASEVLNFGRDGELTAEGLSRIGLVIQTPADAITIMEGTNDVIEIVEGRVSFQSVETNLAAMANRAAGAGLEVTMGTLLPRPPFARQDSSNIVTFGVSRSVRDTAFRQRRDLVDVFDLFLYRPRAFLDLYSPASGDVVGHPNAAGFALIADAFFDSLVGDDTQSPVAGELKPGYTTGTLRPGETIELTVYDLGAGLDPETLTMTINGRPIATSTSGNARSQTLAHDATAASLGCFVRLGFEGSDLAEPANVASKVLASFSVPGGRILKGDLDKSCRVDGIDLLIVAFAFGSRSGEPRYSNLADINNDGVVDGRDFAELASNFGRSS